MHEEGSSREAFSPSVAASLVGVPRREHRHSFLDLDADSLQTVVSSVTLENTGAAFDLVHRPTPVSSLQGREHRSQVGGPGLIVLDSSTNELYPTTGQQLLGFPVRPAPAE